jgi:RNA polymerase sigma-70 factor (ECF subfamily)
VPGGAADDADGLLARVARGDRRAFEALFDLVAPMVFGVCRKVLRDPTLAEEVTQEVMLEVWRTAPRHRSDTASARTWVAVIAHRRAVDRVRSEQAERDRRERDARIGAPTAADPVGEAVADDAERRLVREAMAQLTPIQRESVELAYYGGHTHTEVAALLDLPLGTVKTRIRDGLIRLRDTLGEV